MIPPETLLRVHDDPNLEFGMEGHIYVIAVGYFAPDDTDVHCTHSADDIDGAIRCAETLRKGD